MAELVSDSLVYRYEIGRGAGDGLTGSEGTFNRCTFWLRGADARRPTGGGAVHLREDANLWQSPRAVRRGDRTVGRGAGQLPAGVHAHGIDQRRIQLGSSAGGRGVGATEGAHVRAIVVSGS